MRSILKQNKKGLALIVSYVILIGIALGLSALVYTWMKNRITKPFAEESCDEDVSLILVSANCYSVGLDNIINVTVQNKGLFNVHGYIIKSSDNSEGIAGASAFDLYLYGGGDLSGENSVDFTECLDYSGGALVGNDKNSTLFNHTVSIKQIEIEPFVIDEGETKYCEKSIISHKLDC